MKERALLKKLSVDSLNRLRELAVQAAVKRVLVLRHLGVKTEDFDPFIDKFMAQAEALYAEWPLAA